MKLWKTEFHLMEVTGVKGIVWDEKSPIYAFRWFGIIPTLKKNIEFVSGNMSVAKLEGDNLIRHPKVLVIAVQNRFPFGYKYEVIGSAKEYSHLLEWK